MYLSLRMVFVPSAHLCFQNVSRPTFELKSMKSLLLLLVSDFLQTRLFTLK